MIRLARCSRQEGTRFHRHSLLQKNQLFVVEDRSIGTHLRSDVAHFVGEPVSDRLGREVVGPSVPLAQEFEDPYVSLLVVWIVGILESDPCEDSKFVEERFEVRCQSPGRVGTMKRNGKRFMRSIRDGYDDGPNSSPACWSAFFRRSAARA